jgi:hypothetical protein
MGCIFSILKSRNEDDEDFIINQELHVIPLFHNCEKIIPITEFEDYEYGYFATWEDNSHKSIKNYMLLSINK